MGQGVGSRGASGLLCVLAGLCLLSTLLLTFFLQLLKITSLLASVAQLVGALSHN